MARPANSENIQRDQDGPNYKAAIDLVRGKLRSNDSDQRSLAQDNATLYTRIEKQHGVNSKAAKNFATIDKMAPDKRVDFLRSLLGLLGHAGYDNFDDLVDRAQRPAGTTTPPPKPEKPAKKGPDALDNEDPAVAAQQEREADPMFEEGDDTGNIHPFPGQKTN